MKRIKILAVISATGVIGTCILSGCGKRDNKANDISEKAEITAVENSEMNDEDKSNVPESSASVTQKAEKQKKEDSKSIDSKINISPKNEVKNNHSDIFYVADGELEYNNSKYYVSDSKLITEKAGKKTTLSDQNCAENITIYNNERVMVILFYPREMIHTKNLT